MPADVVRQNITNAGGLEASRYLLDLCASLSSWAGPVKNKTKPGQSTSQLKLAQPKKSIYLLDPSYQCVLAEFSRLLSTLKTSWVSPSQTLALFSIVLISACTSLHTAMDLLVPYG